MTEVSVAGLVRKLPVEQVSQKERNDPEQVHARAERSAHNLPRRGEAGACEVRASLTIHPAPAPTPQVSVVLPTYNEAQNIAELIHRTDAALKVQHEIIIVDDDSPDKTWEIAQNLNLPSVRIIRRINERKLVSAIQRGIDEAKGEYVVWMDADLSMPPELIPKLIEQLNTYSIAVGSRYAKGGKDQRPLLRIVSSRFINLIANIILNFKVKDYDSGFIAARKEVLQNIRLSEKAGYGEYCIEFLYKAGKKYSITEVPYTFIDRRAGESKTAKTLFGLFKYGMLYLKKIIRLRFT